jgi:polysaccharide deacetylase family protein (PEP-CTERM system associated)
VDEVSMIHALSFDVEEWYHSDLLIGRLPAEERVPQVREAIRPILDLLQRAGVRATFFTVGEVARDHPDLVRELVATGHELACHTMTHPNLWRLTASSLEDELAQYRRAVEAAVPGEDVLGFRAPMFSLDRRTGWALGVLRDGGFRYDSSVVPVRTPWYGVPGAPLGVYRASLSDPGQVDEESGFLEFPLTACALGPVRIPAAGGVYLRLIPYPVFRSLLRRVARQRPFVIYLHPWETYHATPLSPLPLLERFGLHVNIRHALNRLERLLSDFSFGPVREVLDL